MNVKSNVLYQNSNFTNSINNYFKIDSTSNFRLNINYSEDLIQINNNQINNFFLENRAIINTFKNQIDKNPSVFEINGNYSISKTKSKLELDINYESWNVKNELKYTTNNDSGLYNDLSTTSERLSSKLNYYYLINKKSAFVFEHTFSDYNYVQVYRFTDSISGNEELNSSQNLDVRKQYVSNNLGILLKINNISSKISLIQGYEIQTLRSYIDNVDITNSIDVNDDKLRINNLGLLGDILIPHKKILFNFNYSFYNNSSSDSSFFNS